MLHAQSAQFAGDRDGAHRAFLPWPNAKTRACSVLRGLFIEAQRTTIPLQAVAAAEEALKVSPSPAWASHAVLGFRCAQGDWTGALDIVENDYPSAIDKALSPPARGAVHGARAGARDRGSQRASRDSVMEAVKLAPTLIPAATLAGKFLSEGQQTRKAMQVIETAWMAQPHPDLADAYAHVRLGDSALERCGGSSGSPTRRRAMWKARSALPASRPTRASLRARVRRLRP